VFSPESSIELGRNDGFFRCANGPTRSPAPDA
jgi:hypothetical protein